jgi:hypothetical protein
MVQVDTGACGAACAKKLWQMRQVRLTTGKDADRVQRIWLIVDEAPLATSVIREYDGTLLLRARSRRGRRLPAAAGAEPRRNWPTTSG